MLRHVYLTTMQRRFRVCYELDKMKMVMRMYDDSLILLLELDLVLLSNLFL